jgi:hypothetical protein
VLIASAFLFSGFDLGALVPASSHGRRSRSLPLKDIYQFARRKIFDVGTQRCGRNECEATKAPSVKLTISDELIELGRLAPYRRTSLVNRVREFTFVFVEHWANSESAHKALARLMDVCSAACEPRARL